jgi:hypothetical protein
VFGVDALTERITCLSGINDTEIIQWHTVTLSAKPPASLDVFSGAVCFSPRTLSAPVLNTSQFKILAERKS